MDVCSCTESGIDGDLEMFERASKHWSCKDNNKIQTVDCISRYIFDLCYYYLSIRCVCVCMHSMDFECHFHFISKQNRDWVFRVKLSNIHSQAFALWRCLHMVTVIKINQFHTLFMWKYTEKGERDPPTQLCTPKSHIKHQIHWWCQRFCSILLFNQPSPHTDTICTWCAHKHNTSGFCGNKPIWQNKYSRFPFATHTHALYAMQTRPQTKLNANGQRKWLNGKEAKKKHSTLVFRKRLTFAIS